MADAPVGYWRFGEASGSVAVDQTGTNPGAYAGGIVRSQAGALAGDADTAIGLDGSSGYVAVANSASLAVGDAFSLEVWVKRGVLGSNQRIFSKGAGWALLQFTVDNRIRFAKSGSGDIAYSTQAVTEKTSWHHIVATKTGASVHLYLDGADVTGSVYVQTIKNTTSRLNIGRDVYGSQYWNGSIDEAALYDHALTSAQIESHYVAARSSLDTTPPSVTITSPTADATVSGPITIAADASDNVGVAAVDFSVDGSLIARRTAAPWTVTLDTTTLANGTHGFAARAYDAAGNASPASAVSVKVSNTSTTRSCTTTVTSITQLESVNGSVQPGDVVCISGTVTTNSNIYLSRSGTNSAPIVYRGGSIRYTGGSASGGLLQVSGRAPWAGAHDIVFDGITLDGGDLIGSGIFVSRGAHHVTVRRCVIKNTGATGIAFNGVDYVRAVGNMIYRAGYNQGWSSGISLWYGGKGGTAYGGATAWYDDTKADLGFHNVIARNIVSGGYDNSGYNSDGNGFIVDGGGDIPPALFVGNVAYHNGGRGFENLGNSGSVWFVNNTSYQNGLDLRIGSGQAPEIMANVASNAHWINNIAYGRKNAQAQYATGYLYNNTSSTISWSRQLAYNGQNASVPSSVTNDPNQYRYTDPLFLSPPLLSASDTSPWANALPPWNLDDRLTLTAGSPAVDAGTDPLTIPGITTDLSVTLIRYLDVDLLGHPRYNGANIDIGAYER